MDRKARERNWFDWSIECGVTPLSFPGVSNMEGVHWRGALMRSFAVV